MICKGKVTHEGKYVVANARVALIEKEKEINSTRCRDDGSFEFPDAIPEGTYKVRCELFGKMREKSFEVEKGKDCEISVDYGDLIELCLFVEDDGENVTLLPWQPWAND